MVAVKDILERLQARRRALGMPYRVLAERAGLSLATVQRALGGGANVRFDTLTMIARAVGATVELADDLTSQAMREAEAVKKARQLAAVAQGSAALEGQAVSSDTTKAVEDRLMHELLAGPAIRLWS